jgi:hypothetical protein
MWARKPAILVAVFVILRSPIKSVATDKTDPCRNAGIRMARSRSGTDGSVRLEALLFLSLYRLMSR